VAARLMLLPVSARYCLHLPRTRDPTPDIADAPSPEALRRRRVARGGSADARHTPYALVGVETVMRLEACDYFRYGTGVRRYAVQRSSVRYKGAERMSEAWSSQTQQVV